MPTSEQPHINESVGDDRTSLEAADRLLPQVYDELRRLAAEKLSHEKAGHSLQAKALVHEAYLRLVGGDHSPTWSSRRHFYAAAAEAMRRILVDRARRRSRKKHGSQFERVDFDVDILPQSSGEVLVEALDETLDRFHLVDRQACELVKLRYFSGLSQRDAKDLSGNDHDGTIHGAAWLR